jgi:NhaD family Na+/H+ antiporter
MVDSIHSNGLWISLIFIIGYLFITFEHYTKINKTTIALLMAVICWVLQFSQSTTTKEENLGFLGHHLTNISQVVFFLIGALTIVEIINVHKGFQLVSNMIQVNSKQKLLWIIGVIAFFLSAVLDNLTTTIVMVTLLDKLVKDNEDKLLMGGGVVIAANAGGAWTPIGDVTTTMLWIGGELSTFNIIKALFVPSFICFIVSFIFLAFIIKRKGQDNFITHQKEPIEPLSKFIFYLGIGCLIFVPFFKIITGLPPFMGMLLGLSVMWLITDIIHFKYEKEEDLRVPNVLSKIDFSSALFFLGILLAVNALESANILSWIASGLDKSIGNVNIIATLIGIVSAIIDNVPLVAATMGMYDLTQYPPDHTLWNLIAYCAGTGGSILLIGSAAGVVFMGMQKVDFFWYLRKISGPALVGYFAGIFVYLLLHG